MRYTKELQENVRKDIKRGIAPKDCAKKYDIPLSVVLKWNNINTNEQRAKEIAIRKYQDEVSNTEAKIENRISKNLRMTISDKEFLEMGEDISNYLYGMTAEVVKKERDLNQKSMIFDGEILLDITEKWNDNNFIKEYSFCID